MSTKSNPDDDGDENGDDLPDPATVRSECIEFTTEVPDRINPDEEPDTIYFSFVCPRCEALNPLKTHPSNFKNKPFRCVECRYIPLLDADALDDFIAEEEL